MPDTKPELFQLEGMSSDIKDGLTNANAPSAGDPVATIADVTGAPSGFSAVPEDDRLVVNDTPANGADASYQIDFSALPSPISVPVGATHAIVRTLVTGRGGGGSFAESSQSLFLAAYDATPSNIELDKFLAVENLIRNAEHGTLRGSVAGHRIVELNSPVDPSGDLTVRLQTTLAIEQTVRVWVEGFLS
jgi:hypothetical protein